MTYPLLSIITINFNNADGLWRTMSSVFEQSFTDFEYIIIDGGSKDGSSDIIKENDKKLAHWISEEDSGIYNAMNKGIRASKGQYLLFLNSGDLLNGETAISDFVNHKHFFGDIIYGDYLFENGEKIYPDILYPAYFMKTSLPHQSTFFKRQLFNEMGYYDEKYPLGADRAFYIKCYLSDKYTFRHVNYLLTQFDLTGISNSKEFLIRKKREDELLLRNEYGDTYEQYKKELDDEFKRNAIPKYSIKGIIKRVKYRIQILWKRP